MDYRRLAICLLYLAFVLSWAGTFITTCTQNDTDSLLAGMIYSAPFYISATLMLVFRRLTMMEFLFTVPLLGLLLWQAVWSARLVWMVYVDDLATCNLITGWYFGQVTDPVRERVFAAYYLAASTLPVAAIILSHLRHRRLVATSAPSP